MIVPCKYHFFLFLVFMVTGRALAQGSFMKQKALPAGEDSVITAPGRIYKANSLKRFFFGDHYRQAWATPIKVPVARIGELKGGLNILGPGGGMQTYSLKLKGEDEKLYSFRSIQKDPSPVLPRPVKPTFFADIVQDQISAAHPYGAFILPPLAHAAGIYHTNPKLYYLPATPALGKYQKKFGGMMMMFEEDADEDWTGKESFGFTENAVSTETVIENLMEENESYVDEAFLLRARLFDMWIGDWDRHEGQWRWAELEDEKGNEMYRPIPEDRDNAFFKFDGFFPWWLRRKWALRKFQQFGDDVRDIAGLNDNARHFDRRFLTSLSRTEWLAEADSLQQRLTDTVIERAVKQWPEKIYALNGAEIIRHLKARRERLKTMAAEYYAILAKEVNVYGSNEAEYFEIKRKNNLETEVRVFDLSDGEKDELLFHRTFYTHETNEARLYGFGDDDRFHVKGKVGKGMVIRMIGGEGHDTFTDESAVAGLKKHTLIYDLQNSDLNLFKETKNRTSNNLNVNQYDPEAFEYDLVAPRLSFGFNPDDGLFIGGGALIRKEGSRKSPYASEQRILANVSTASGAWNFEYSGEFIGTFNTMDLVLDASVRAPNFNSNFYGFGNNTVEEFDVEYYNYRIDEVKVAPAFQARVGQSRFRLGPLYEYYKARPNGGILAEPGGVIDPIDLEPQHYLGSRFTAQVGKVDSETYPENGVLWSTTLSLYEGINVEDRSFSTLQSDLRLYYTFEDTHTTLATRLGGGHNTGDAPFFKANVLGGNQGLGLAGNLRGMRRNRFSGQTSFYHNFEIRQKLSYFESYLATALVGVNLFVDHGRVWQPGEDSGTWHRSIGGGVWFRLYYKWVLTASYASSNIDDTFDVQIGFLF